MSTRRPHTLSEFDSQGVHVCFDNHKVCEGQLSRCIDTEEEEGQMVTVELSSSATERI